MTVDKALAYPEWEGNDCVLSIPTADGKMTLCLWKMSHGTTKDEFQEFIETFCCVGMQKTMCFKWIEHNSTCVDSSATLSMPLKDVNLQAILIP